MEADLSEADLKILNLRFAGRLCSKNSVSDTGSGLIFTPNSGFGELFNYKPIETGW